MNFEYKGYKGSIEIKDNGMYRGKILGIKDLVTYESSSKAGLNIAFMDAVDDYIGTCKQLGREPQ